MRPSTLKLQQYIVDALFIATRTPQGVMRELTVNHWRRFGHDRLYVNLADGTRVGWLDRRTGATTLERPDLNDEFTQALAAHGYEVTPGGEGDVGASPPPEKPPDATDTTSSVAPATTSEDEPFAVRIDWRDLSANTAGGAVSEQAAAARQAAPVRTLAARLLGVHTEERAWRVGAAGERKVAARLDRLPETWKVLHALPVGTRGADIDHFVVGPGGVFTINAKNHPDANVWVAGNTFMVNGQKHPYVRNARHEASRAARLLSAALGGPVGVRGVIAVVGATKGFTVKEQPRDVQVVPRKRLHKWLQSLPEALPPGRVLDIHNAARRSSTWQ